MFNGEVIAFILYFVLIVGIGFYFFLKDRNKNGEKEYFIGGRAMGPWVTAMSAQASDMSAWLLMGLPGSIMAFGFGQMWIGIGLALGTAANWIFVATRLRKFSKVAGDAITLPQYLSNRFATKSHTLQIICALIFFVCFTVYVASGFVAGVNAALRAMGEESLIFPPQTVIGSMAQYVSVGSATDFQPMNANFGIIAPLPAKVKGGKSARNQAYAARSLAHIEKFSRILFGEAESN